MTTTPERSPLVLSGEFERIPVADLRPGDVTALDEVVHQILSREPDRTLVQMTNGHLSVYGAGETTTLVKTRNLHAPHPPVYRLGIQR